MCPRHYCEYQQTYDATKQCAKGRRQNSILCSECEDNKSVVLGAETCQPCDHRAGGFWILLGILLMTLFVLAVMCVNLDSYSTYLNAFFFSYQIIPLIIEDIPFRDKFISTVVSFSQLSGTGEWQTGVCIGFKLKNISKTLFNYLIPIYLIACTAIIGFVSYYLKGCRFNRETTFRAFVFISVVAYCDFTRITFELLEPIELGNHYAVYHAAYMRYFGKEHAPYAACAIVVLIFVVIGFPLALIFSYVITANARFVKLKAIFDTFRDPFITKPNYDLFPVFYFTSRLLLLLVDSCMGEGAVRDTVLAMSSVLIASIFLFLQPYKSKDMNYHDSLLLVNIAVIAILKMAYDLTSIPNERYGFGKTIHILTYLPFVCLTLRFLTWSLAKIRKWRTGRGGNMRRGKCYSYSGLTIPGNKHTVGTCIKELKGRVISTTGGGEDVFQKKMS